MHTQHHPAPAVTHLVAIADAVVAGLLAVDDQREPLGRFDTQARAFDRTSTGAFGAVERLLPFR